MRKGFWRVEEGGKGTNALGHYNGTDHACSEVAMLARGNEVFGHSGG